MKLALASLWLTWASVLAAQADTERLPVVLTTVLAADGTPIPGVPVHAIRYVEFGAPTVVGGWLRVVDVRLGRLERSRPTYSDPDGRVGLLLPNGRTAGHHVFVGAPFAGSLAMTGEPRELKVFRLEQFTVEVVDGDGAPMPHFPVALHADRRDREVAWSNGQGLAVFGLPATFEARLTVAPAGWIGPREGMPTLARGLRRERARLVVPPFGSVRVRALVAGAPGKVKFDHAVLEQPVRTVGVNVGSAGEVAGIEFGPIALGQDVHGSVRGNGVQASFAGRGPTQAGEQVVLDVELSPMADAARPQPPVAVRRAAPLPPVVVPQPAQPVRPFPRFVSPPQGELCMQLVNVPAGAENSLTCRFYDGDERQVANSMLHWQREGDRWQLRHPVPAGRLSVRLLLNHAEILTIAQVEVPAGGATADERLAAIDVGSAVRRVAARVRVVDQDGIPILGARFEIRNSSMAAGGAGTDEAGYAVLCPQPAAATPVIVRADGMRCRELHGLVDGAVITLRPEPWLTVELSGLPTDLPRERLAIMLRHVVRERLDATVFGAVGEGDRVRMPLPIDGRYRVLLVVKAAGAGAGSWSSSTVDEHPEHLVVGDEAPGEVRYRVDAATVERLRQALAAR